MKLTRISDVFKHLESVPWTILLWGLPKYLSWTSSKSSYSTPSRMVGSLLIEMDIFFKYLEHITINNLYIALHNIATYACCECIAKWNFSESNSEKDFTLAILATKLLMSNHLWRCIYCDVTYTWQNITSAAGGAAFDEEAEIKNKNKCQKWK